MEMFQKTRLMWGVSNLGFTETSTSNRCTLIFIRKGELDVVQFLFGVSEEFLEESGFRSSSERGVDPFVQQIAKDITSIWDKQVQNIELLRFSQFPETENRGNRFKRILTTADMGSGGSSEFINRIESGVWQDPFTFAADTEEWVIDTGAKTGDVLLFPSSDPSCAVRLNRVSNQLKLVVHERFDIGRGAVGVDVPHLRQIDIDLANQLRHSVR